MTKRILIIQGHPDSRGDRFGHALADAYAAGAEQAGHTVKRIDIAELDFPLLRSKEDFDKGDPPPAIADAQEAITWADHLVFVHPLWLGAMPALLKGFLEQVFRPGFAMEKPDSGYMWKKRLKGKTARIIVTMGMPALIYRWYYGAYSVKSFKRNILTFCGISPVDISLIGTVEAKNDKKRKRWLQRIEAMGGAGR